MICLGTSLKRAPHHNLGPDPNHHHNSPSLYPHFLINYFPSSSQTNLTFRRSDPFPIVLQVIPNLPSLLLHNKEIHHGALWANPSCRLIQVITMAKSMNEWVLIDLRRQESELAINIKKATSPEETAPKRKHVRSCIVYTWDHKSSASFWSGMKVYVSSTSSFLFGTETNTASGNLF
jgi:hypothetical protein